MHFPSKDKAVEDKQKNLDKLVSGIDSLDKRNPYYMIKKNFLISVYRNMRVDIDIYTSIYLAIERLYDDKVQAEKILEAVANNQEMYNPITINE